MNTKVKEKTKEFIKLNGFVELTNVQKEVLNNINSKNDMIVISSTGTGKTHAYLIPIMEMINTVSDKTQVVICLPTRELAYQVSQNCKLMQEVLPDLRVMMLSGGTDKQRSINKLNKPPHIIIGTPGRIKDLFLSNALRVDFVQMFVIDEADMSLEDGFLEDIDVVFSHMVKNPKVLCFSATFPKELSIFTNKYLNKPKTIKVTDKKRDPHINHILVNCKHKDYKEKAFDIINGFKPYLCLIFANSKEYANETYDFLKQKGLKIAILHGGLESRDRQRIIKDIKNNKYSYVVATDVASRGIDIDSVSHVISMGLPSKLQFYMHRAGRTGRNSRDGICYLLYKEEDVESIKKINAKGINFAAMDYKKGSWQNTNNPTKKRQIKIKLEDKEIAKTLYRKNEKVKPNYKKKKKQEIEKIKRKKKREYIKNKIKEERKERYKKSQREKNK